jgi:hypothetical protein
VAVFCVFLRAAAVCAGFGGRIGIAVGLGGARLKLRAVAIGCHCHDRILWRSERVRNHSSSDPSTAIESVLVRAAA